MSDIDHGYTLHLAETIAHELHGAARALWRVIEVLRWERVDDGRIVPIKVLAAHVKDLNVDTSELTGMLEEIEQTLGSPAAYPEAV